jgi:predicted nicotinamide N-methyase
MPGYRTRQLVVTVGGLDYRIRALSDLQQYSDPLQEAEDLGISSAQWPLFGQVWPSGRILAELMATIDIAARRILEIGCGLGLSSLVLHRREADITASDQHPLAREFLDHNAQLNGLPAVPYRDLHWDAAESELGRFDLIIGSDILYERGHAESLAQLILRHALPTSEVIVTDPGRGHSAAFSRALELQGYDCSETRSAAPEGESPGRRGRLLRYRR